MDVLARYFPAETTKALTITIFLLFLTALVSSQKSNRLDHGGVFIEIYYILPLSLGAV